MSIGVGLTVTLRVRMGSHDAHYAGELVDGARILGLFGDVATELLIRLDGDEGLFRAYEAIRGALRAAGITAPEESSS